MEAKMSNYYLMLDEAKVRQAELAREIENTRIRKELKRGRKPNAFAKKLQTLFTSLA
jgi:hypothetical protein